jgi:hypothetical protein
VPQPVQLSTELHRLFYVPSPGFDDEEQMNEAF